MRTTYFAAVIVAIGVACSDGEESTPQPPPPPAITTVETEEPEEIPETAWAGLLEREVGRLKGGGSIRTATIEDSVVTLEYVADYREYAASNPGSGLDEGGFESYWATGDAVEKAIVDAPVRLMRKLPFVKRVEVWTPTLGRDYKLSVPRSGVEELTQSIFKQLQAKWTERFVDPFLYTESGRRRFIGYFQVPQ